MTPIECTVDDEEPINLHDCRKKDFPVRVPLPAAPLLPLSPPDIWCAVTLGELNSSSTFYTPCYTTHVITKAKSVEQKRPQVFLTLPSTGP